MTKPWHMARAASRRQLPKPRKMMGPVGEKVDASEGIWRAHVSVRRGTIIGRDEVSCCTGCGYHVCSCAPRERMFEGNRTIWCTTCWGEHDVTPVGTPLPTCKHCGASGHWWTRSRKHPNGCPCAGCVP